MKITKSELKKLIAEEINEVKLAVDTRGQGDRYGHMPNITGPFPEYSGHEDEEEETPCGGSHEPPDLETRVAGIEQKLDMIMSQLSMAEGTKQK